MKKIDLEELKKSGQILNKQERICQQISKQCKPNPNHYPIIDKWNRKYIWNPNKNMIFNFLISAIDERMQEVIDNGELFEQLCDVKQIPY